MNSFSRLGLFAACVSCSNFFALAVTVNDGTSANNLVKLSNANSGGDAVATLEVNTNGFLVAAQTNVSSDFPLSTVWYAGEVVPTGGVYTVAGDFRPATDSFASRGGVMGWLSLASSNGIALQVSPNDPVSAQTTFRVSTIDFSAGNGDDSDSFNHLFTTNGVAAAPVFGSALSAANPNYSLTNLATFQLAFSAPSAADIAALSNATAHLMA